MMTKMFARMAGLCLLPAIVGNAWASGFAIIEQSVSGLGNAYAGGAASAEDTSTIFYNPAGMTLLKGQQVIGGVHIIYPQTEFKVETARNVFGGSLGTNESGNGANLAIVPNLYYSNKLNDKLAVGFGIFAPFGLATEYDKDWVGRYHAVESDVTTINFNPSVAYQVTDKLSIGAGVSVQYMDVTLSSMIDGGAILALEGEPVTPSDTDYDIFGENIADDIDFGFNLGLLYRINDATRIGLAYRSEIAHKLEGKFKADLNANTAGLAAMFTTQDIYGKIDLPASASASVFHQINDRLALMADVSWTGWNSFQKIDIVYEGDGVGPTLSRNSVTTAKWEDTWRYSIGATYKATEELALRCGLAYDESPIPDESFRTPRIPGTDRTWLSIGLNYAFSDSLSTDFGYTHLFVDNSSMNKNASNLEDTLRGTVVGEFKNSVDIFSAQVNYNF